ncbi:unnamed protein product [Sympodiomycopsis kandeliae]
MLARLVSLDHFRSRVYRPRLALIILLVLLSGSVTPPPFHTGSTNSSKDASIGPTTSSISLVDRGTTWLKRRLNSNDEADIVSSTYQQSTPRNDIVEKIEFVSSPTDSKGKKKSSHKLVISLFLSPSIFPTLIQLHLLWVIRFIAGEIEGRRSTSKFSLPTTILTIAFLLSSIIATLQPTVSSVLTTFAKNSVMDSNVIFQDQNTLFPIGWILSFETVTTILALFPLVLKSSSTAVNLPSPSHFPSLLEMLPFWARIPFLAAAEQPSARSRHSMMTSMMNNNSRNRRHGSLASAAIAAEQEEERRARSAALGPTTRFDHDSSGRNSDSESHNHHAEQSSDTTSQHSRHETSTDSQSPSVDQSGSGASVEHSRSTSSQSVDDEMPSGTPLWTTMEARPSREAARVLRLQDDMVRELETVGRLSPSTSSARSRAPLDGKSLHQRRQTVSLPLTYVLSICTTMISSLSLILCYSVITLKLPNLAPTSVPAIVSLLALRAEIGGLVKYWNEERRRIEGLEFVRRRWGSHTNNNNPIVIKEDSQCSICFEPIDWTSSHGTNGDGVKLDCDHELHAPCLVPWLMSQSFCPVCHTPLRPVGGHHHQHHRSNSHHHSARRHSRNYSNTSSVNSRRSRRSTQERGPATSGQGAHASHDNVSR